MSQNLKDVYKREFGKNIDSAAGGEGKAHPNSHPPLYIFVSLSMPMPGLIDLGKQAKAYGGVLVLRGLVEGSYRKTALKLQAFIEQTKVGMIVDPLLFRQYKIQTTPTVVIASASSKTFDKISGFIPIQTALEQIEKEGELKESATGLLTQASLQETVQ